MKLFIGCLKFYLQNVSVPIIQPNTKFIKLAHVSTSATVNSANFQLNDK